jgi:hypothetical protein
MTLETTAHRASLTSGLQAVAMPSAKLGEGWRVCPSTHSSLRGPGPCSSPDSLVMALRKDGPSVILGTEGHQHPLGPLSYWAISLLFVVRSVGGFEWQALILISCSFGDMW